MATAPIICNTIDFQGIIFDRCNLQVISGNSNIRKISLCDTDIQISNYSSFSGCVHPNSRLLLNASELGELGFILIKATYSTILPIASRFINILYKGKSFPMSNLTILSGNPIDTSPYIPGNRGWDLDPINDGGMLLYNPHGVKVKVDVILASTL